MNRYIQWSKSEMPFQRNNAQEMKEAFEETYKDENYVLRWISNDKVPNQEILDFWKHCGFRFNMQKAKQTRKKEFKNEVICQFKYDTFIDNKGVIRWKSNKKVPPQEVLDRFKSVNAPFNMEKAIKTREKEQREFIEQYKNNQKNREKTPEELAEMRAAFGKGTTVVNPLTGEKTKL